MVKPIRPAELAARIEALLRRAYPAQASPHAPLRLGDYAFDCALRKVTCNGQPIGHQSGVSCFAEYAVVDRGSVVVIDPTLPLDIAALFGCAVVTGVGAVINTAQIRPGSTVWSASRRPCSTKARAAATASRSPMPSPGLAATSKSRSGPMRR